MTPRCANCAATFATTQDAEAPTPQSGCEVCGKPGDLTRIKGELMHPHCAPQGWEPTPEEIAP